MKKATGKSGVLYVARIGTGLANGQLLEERLGWAGLDLVQVQNLDARRVYFDEYFRSRADADRKMRELKLLFRQWLGAKSFSTQVRRVAVRDWSESWKKSFHTARVSRRIVIKPSWEKYRPHAGDCVIELDPGMSFGTGLHATTRACLGFIDQLAGRNVPHRSFLDAGCGSGVLAIAAAKLGFTGVVAVDNDPQAVKAATENCRRNGVSGIVKCMQADLLNFRTKSKFSVVAANMFESEHERFGRTLSSAVTADPPGYLLVAGVLFKQYSCVTRMYERMGFRKIQSVVQREWISGMMQKS